MKGKYGGVVVVALLLIATTLLGYGVATKMRVTAVTAQDRTLDANKLGMTTPVSPAPDTNVPSAVFVGDFTQGSLEGGVGAENWTSRLTAELGKSVRLRTVVDNQGEGSGYVIRGPSPGFGDEVRSLVKPDAELVVISGSRNDVVADPNAVNARARELYGLIQQLAPGSQVVAIGPTWGSEPPSPEILATRDAIRDAATASNVFFVDPLAEGWFTGGEPGLIGTDSIHPTDRGNEVMAQRLLPVFGNLLSQHGFGGG